MDVVPRVPKDHMLKILMAETDTQRALGSEETAVGWSPSFREALPTAQYKQIQCLPSSPPPTGALRTGASHR